jgi:hypothetical protein
VSKGETELYSLLVAPAPLGREGLGKEATVVEITLCRLLAERIELTCQVVELHPFKEAF